MPTTTDSNATTPDDLITVPSLQVIQVQYDAARHLLSATPARVVVKAGDVVIWQFSGTPTGFFPWVRFDPGSGEHPFGPMNQLSQGGEGLWGEARRAGTYTYRAAIQGRFGTGGNEELAAIYSRRVELEVAAAATPAAATAPENLVQVSRGSSAGQLSVSPNYVGIHTGESIVWEFDPEIFSDYPEPLVARIEFTRYEGEFEVSELHYGPFTTMTYTAEIEGGGTVNRITGTGSVRRPGLYRYRALAIRESTGEIVFAVSDDPVADDMGDPGGG